MLSLLAAMMLQAQPAYPALDDAPEIVYLPGIEHPHGVVYVNGEPETTGSHQASAGQAGDGSGSSDGSARVQQIYMTRSNAVDIDGSEVPLYDVPRYLEESLNIPFAAKLILRVNEDVSGSPLTELMNNLRDAGYNSISVFIL